MLGDLQSGFFFFFLSFSFFFFPPFPLFFTAPLQTLQQNTPTLQKTYLFFFFLPFWGLFSFFFFFLRFLFFFFLPLQILEEESGRVEQSRSKYNFASNQASQQLAASGETFSPPAEEERGKGELCIPSSFSCVFFFFPLPS